MSTPCTHLQEAGFADGQADGCEECLETGGRWVHLRQCLTCGHVGCCDSSPGWHARAHYKATGHPVIGSAEPGDAWRWCYINEIFG
jgi:uncharacterized UBP type Zn finger protein